MILFGSRIGAFSVWPESPETFDEKLFANELRVSNDPGGIAVSRLRVELAIQFRMESTTATAPSILAGTVGLQLEDAKGSIAKSVTGAPKRLLPATPTPLRPGTTPGPVRVIPIDRPDTSSIARRIESVEDSLFRRLRNRSPQFLHTYRLEAASRFQSGTANAFGPTELQAIRKITLAFVKPIFRPLSSTLSKEDIEASGAFWTRETSLDCRGRGRLRLIAELVSGSELILIDTGEAPLIWDSPELPAVDNVHVATPGLHVEFRDLYSHAGWRRLTFPETAIPRALPSTLENNPRSP